MNTGLRRILIDVPGMGRDALFNPDARDACTDPFIYLRDRLRQLGYELTTADDHPVAGCVWILFWNAPDIHIQTSSLLNLLRSAVKRLVGRELPQPVGESLYQSCVRAGMRNRLVLFNSEPAVVQQQNWDPMIHRRFPIVFTWNDSYVDNKKFHKFHFPVTGRFPAVEAISFRQRKLLVNISGNKFSPHPGELYTARRQTIRYFEQNHLEQFDLFGVGWEHPGPGQIPYLSYRGIVKHKWDVFPNYRFGVCYENTCSEIGGVSEKIFDCMRAGSVPVYWGAPNITDFVDAEAFIDRRSFRSDAELADFLLSMTESEYGRYRDAIQSYLRSDRFAAFLPSAFADNIISVLSL